MASQLQSSPIEHGHELDEDKQQTSASGDQLRALVDQLTHRLEAQTRREAAAYLERAEAEVLGQKQAEQIKSLEASLKIEKAAQIELKRQFSHQRSIANRAQASEKNLREQMLLESERLHLHISKVEGAKSKIVNSISWRYTAPIRSIVRFLRRIFKRSI